MSYIYIYIYLVTVKLTSALGTLMPCNMYMAAWGLQCYSLVEALLLHRLHAVSLRRIFDFASLLLAPSSVMSVFFCVLPPFTIGLSCRTIKSSECIYISSHLSRNALPQCLIWSIWALPWPCMGKDQQLAPLTAPPVQMGHSTSIMHSIWWTCWCKATSNSASLHASTPRQSK